jgi:hypothetical protein
MILHSSKEQAKHQQVSLNTTSSGQAKNNPSADLTEGKKSPHFHHMTQNNSGILEKTIKYQREKNAWK